MQPSLKKRRLEKSVSVSQKCSNKGVIIYRVSSMGQAKDGWSLPAQRKYLHEHAKKHNIEIVKEFEEKESARKTGRKIFNEMISYLKQHKNITNILVEKTDRLYRNFRDYVTLDEMGINLHFVKENTVICPTSRSHEKFVHGIKVLIAKNFIDNLREETTKGLIEKAEEGYYPGGCVAVGYKHEKNLEGKKIIVPDEEKALFIRRAFTLYSLGNISMRNLAKKLADEGFRTNRGRLINHKGIEHILQNPLYMGKFYWSGKLYQGKHKPLIDEQLYNSVQDMFSNPLRAKKRNEEALYTGIFKCGICGKMITVERQRGSHNSGKYVYYRCGNNECKSYYISEVKVEQNITDLLGSIRVKPEYVADIKKGLLELHKIKSSEESGRIQRIHIQIEENETMLNRLLDKYIQGMINDEIYKKREAELTERIGRLKNELAGVKTVKHKFIEYVENVLELCKEAPELYLRASIPNRKNLIKLVCLNPTMTGGKIDMKLHPAFENFQKFDFGKRNVEDGTRTHKALTT